jgi:hypothetical protein
VQGERFIVFGRTGETGGRGGLLDVGRAVAERLGIN